MSTSSNLFAKNMRPGGEISDDDRLFAALAYVSQLVIPALIPILILLSKERNARPFQRYHAIQSLGLLVLYLILLFVMLFGGLVTLGCMLVIFFIPTLAVTFSFLYYAYLAHKGLYFEIPVVTNMVRSYLENIPQPAAEEAPQLPATEEEREEG